MATVAARLAALVQARANCDRAGNAEWRRTHSESINAIETDLLPHGSGIDAGCSVDLEKSDESRLVIDVPFHLMDPNGYYCGWRDYRVIVRPAFDGISIRVTGRDYNGLKDCLAELFHHALTLETK